MISKDLDQALKYALRLLKYRLRTEAEIALRLRHKNYSPAVIFAAQDKLKEYGYLDDENFARIFINSRLERGWGSRRIILSLKKLGVGADCYQKFLPSAPAESKSLRALAERKLKFYQGKKNMYQKLSRFLANRGFNSGAIAACFEAMGIKGDFNGEE